MGGTNFGFCYREWVLWYGDGTDPGPCQVPLTDGKPCGDTGLSQPRCPYNRTGLNVELSNITYTTYSYLNNPRGA